MKRKLNKAISILLASIMIFGAAPLAALAEIDLPDLPSLKLFDAKANAADESNLTFELINDGTEYEVTDCRENISGELVIPSTYNGLPVTSIGDYAFYGCKYLRSVIVPDSVKSIGESAFESCKKLTGITIPNSVTSLGEEAFYSCTELLNAVIGNGVKEIQQRTFFYCEKLENVEIGNSVETIGEESFSDCSALKNIIIPDSVTSIGVRAFDSCKSISTVVIGEGVKVIEAGAFSFCESLENINVGSNINKLGHMAFSPSAFTRNLDNYEDGLLYLDEYLIDAEVTLVSPNCIIKEGTRVVTDGILNMYESCITSIEFPSSLEVIGEDNLLFETLSGIKVSSNNKYYFSDENGVLYNKDKTKIIRYPMAKEENSFVIPDSVKTIGYRAFGFDVLLESVIIPESVTDIEDEAFMYCGLTSVAIPNSVTNIGAFIFSSCAKLTSFKLSESIDYIGEGMFAECTGLATVLIPDNIISICSFAFEACSALKNVEMSESLQQIGYFAFKDSGLESLVIPGSVKSIACEAFCGCINLKNVTLENGISVLDDLAFYYCTSLESIEIPESVTYIGFYTFNGCASLNNIKICGNDAYLYRDTFEDTAYFNDEKNWENGILYIDNYLVCAKDVSGKCVIKPGTKVIAESAFYYSFDQFDCYITELDIPESVEYIYRGAFNGCNKIAGLSLPSGLKRIGIEAFSLECFSEDDCDEYGGLYKDGYLLYLSNKFEGVYNVRLGTKLIADGAFARCNKLTGINIPDSVYSERLNWLFGCQGVEQYEIPKNTEIIDTQAFVFCESLKEIEIPNNVKEIRMNAFRDCVYLEKVVIHEGVKYIGDYAFINCFSLKDFTIPKSVDFICDYSIGYTGAYESIDYSKVEDLVIRCYAGTAGEEYAIRHGFNYELLEDEPIEHPSTVIESSDKSMNVSIEFPAGTFGENEGNMTLKVENISSVGTANQGDFRIRGKKPLAIYNISPLNAQGDVIQPTGIVKVRIAAPKGVKNGDKLTVLHWGKDRVAKEYSVVVANYMIEVETSSFSEFGVYREMTVFERIMDFFVTLFRNIFSFFTK